MTILFDATDRVKSHKPFATGLTRQRPARGRFIPSAAELAWAAANLNTDTTCYEVTGPSDEALEQAAGCALATARHEAGFRCY